MIPSGNSSIPNPFNEIVNIEAAKLINYYTIEDLNGSIKSASINYSCLKQSTFSNIRNELKPIYPVEIQPGILFFMVLAG